MAFIRSALLLRAAPRQIVVRSPKLRQHISVRFTSTTAGPDTSSPSFLRRAFRFTTRAAFFTAIGYIMAVAPAYQTVSHIIAPPSDEETLTMFVPAEPEAKTVEETINSHPLAAALRARPDLAESRPHMKIPPAYKSTNLTGGTLLGPGRVTVPPFAWADEHGRELVQVCHLGTDMCGHPGVVHGGFLATLLDEGLARCCFAALPHRIGMTASLTVNYRAPAPADSYVVLRANTTKVEGRKAWVTGRIETLVDESKGEKPLVLAEAEGLFISPRHAATMARLNPVT